MTTPSNNLPPDAEAHYKDLVDSLAILSEASNRMAKLETEVLDDYLDAVDNHSPRYVKLQLAIAQAYTSIKDIAGLHPEWFVDAKTITTPYGTVQSRAGKKLEVPNPEVSIKLLQQLGIKDSPFLRITTELNMEALEVMSDEELARLRITRVKTESISVKITKPKLGKAVAAATKKAKKNAVAAESGTPQTA